MIDDEPPVIDPSQLSFDDVGPARFHDLMHPIWACDDKLLHVRRWWEFQAHQQIHRVIFCRVGYHHVVKQWKRPSRCVNCSHRMRHDVTPEGVGCVICGCKDLKLTDNWQIAFACYYCGHEPPLIAPEESND